MGFDKTQDCTFSLNIDRRLQQLTIGCQIHLRLLFPTYPATKRHTYLGHLRSMVLRVHLIRLSSYHLCDSLGLSAIKTER